MIQWIVYHEAADQCQQVTVNHLLFTALSLFITAML